MSTESTDVPLLEIRNLTKHFPLTQGIIYRRTIGQVRAVDGVSLTVGHAETVGLVGESGCGKSTVSRVAMALQKPTSGQVFYRGKDIFDMGRRERQAFRRNVQLIFQDPYTSLNPRMTVGNIIAEPWVVHSGVVPRSERSAKIGELLERVGLDPRYANRYPHQFSGGQRQRIGIARALALQPELVICDEPVSALDVSVQAQVINLLEDLQRDFGLSYLFIAHDLSVVRHLSNTVNVMYLGKIVESGNHDQVYDRPAHPYTQALLSAVPTHNPELRGKKERIMLTGDVPSPANPPSGCRFRTRCPKVEEICSTEEPALEIRPGVNHPVACHSAQPHTLLTTADN